MSHKVMYISWRLLKYGATVLINNGYTGTEEKNTAVKGDLFSEMIFLNV